MERNKRFCIITKILGVFAVFSMIIGFFVIDDANIVEYLFMASFFLGGVFNLLDFWKPMLCIIAFAFYSISSCLSASIGLSKGIISSDFIISFVALLISLLRCFPVLKKSGKYNANIFSKKIGTSSVNQQSNSSGCLSVVIGIILLFVGLYIMGVRLKFFVFFTPIG